MNALVIAAPHSGCGKTLLTLGILESLKRRGVKLAPFKVGPDFIDPGYHRLITGTPSVNLDGWMCPASFVAETYAYHASGADLAVVEGVMGLFDGIDGASEAGSTAQVAKLIGAPVVLVVDARSQGRSAAALVHGFASFDPGVAVAGVIFNNVASANHEAILREALAASCPGVQCVGCVPRDAELSLPSRHLGLVTAEENPLSGDFLDRLSSLIERHLDLDLLLRLSGSTAFETAGEPASNAISTPSDPPQRPFPFKGRDRVRMGVRGTTDDVSIAVAKDAAFCFVYEDNLRLLREHGARLVEFSPLEDKALPPDIGGIYLPGGYPELFAERLSENGEMQHSIRAAVRAGMPLYAECGGFMYLTEGLAGEDGTTDHPFVGIYPVRTRMLPRRKALGYREVRFLTDGISGAAGTVARGHEFHYSEIEDMPAAVPRLYTVSRKGVVLGSEGYIYKNCLASYIHLHFGSNPDLARRFVEQCRAYRERSLT